MTFCKPFHGYIVCCTLYGVVGFHRNLQEIVITVREKFSLHSESQLCIAKLASSDLKAGNFEGKSHNECSIRDFIGRNGQ